MSGVYFTCHFRYGLLSSAGKSGFEICSNMCGCINFEQMLYTRPVICYIPTRCNVGFEQEADFCKVIAE
jgi:hypothetical protein